MMKKLIQYWWVGIPALFIAGSALADYAATPGSGLTFASNLVSGALYMANMFCDMTAGKTQCAAVSAAGAVKVDGSAVTQPVSGTIGLNNPSFNNAFPAAGMPVGMSQGGNMVAFNGSGGALEVCIWNGVACQTLNSNGQAVMANSAPVVIASNQSAVPISAAVGTLAVGAALDGWNVTQGAKADASCGTATGTCSLIALLKFLNTAVSSPVPANPLGATVAGSASQSVVLKNSPGTLYNVYATCTSACWLMIFNAIAAPSNGATTAGTGSGQMQDCIPIQAGGVGGLQYNILAAESFSVGISAVISSTACANLTLSATGFIHGQTL